jgi:hypothetical protein
MVRRRLVKVLLVAVMVAVPSAVAALFASEIASQVDVARAGVTLRAHHAVALDLYGFPAATTLDLSSLAPEVAAGRAYTTVLFGAGADPGFTDDGHRLVYVIGEAARELFPSLRLCRPAPCVMRGHDVPRASSGQAFGSVPRPGQDVLPSGAALLAPNAGIIRLDEAVVLVLPASVIPELSADEALDAASGAVLLDPAPAALDQVIDPLPAQGVSAVPRPLAGATGELQQSIARAALFLCGAAAFAAVVLIAFAASVGRLVEQERRSLAIRRAYGATARGVRLRLGVFLACVGVGPAAVLLSLQGMDDAALARSAQAVLLVLALVWVWLWVRVCSASATDRAPVGAGGGL